MLPKYKLETTSLQSHNPSKVACIASSLAEIEEGEYVYYADLVQVLAVRHSHVSLKQWRAYVSRCFPEGSILARHKELSQWVRLKSSNGYIIFARKADYQASLPGQAEARSSGFDRGNGQEIRQAA